MEVSENKKCIEWVNEILTGDSNTIPALRHRKKQDVICFAMAGSQIFPVNW